MEEEIKILDQDVEEYEKEKDDEISKQKHVTVGDIIIIQLILCILVVITIVVLNIAKPDITSEIIKNAKIQLDKPYQMSREITEVFEEIKEILNV